jgi:integrase
MASVGKQKWTYKGTTKTSWMVRYLDSSGVRRGKSFAFKREADAFRMKVEREIERGEHVAASAALTVKSICEQFIRVQEDRVSDGRIGRGRLRNIKMAIDKSINPRLSARKMQELRPVDIEDWYRAMCREDGLAPMTAKNRVFMLRMVEDFAQRRGYVRKTPVREAMKELRGIPRTVIRTFSRSDMDLLLQAADRRGAGRSNRNFMLLQCAVHLAAFCGLRWGEIMGLTISAVDLGGRTVHVWHNLTDYDELKGPKTPAGIRDVPMPQHLRVMLSRWLDRHYVENDRGLVFRTPNGKRIRYANFHAGNWQPLLARAGLLRDTDNLHFHALRHFAASWMIENALPLTEVASLLGHKKFDMTLQVYAHPISGGLARSEAMDQMAAKLLEGPLTDGDRADDFGTALAAGSQKKANRDPKPLRKLHQKDQA